MQRANLVASRFRLMGAMSAAAVVAWCLPLVARAEEPEQATAADHAEMLVALSAKVDAVWVLVAAALVFFMQAGFLCLEVGMVRERSIQHVAVKNLVDWCVVSICFAAVGFGFMFGHSRGGLIGSDFYFLSGIEAPGTNELGWIFFMFQLGFASTAITIVSGAVNERIAFLPYLVVAALVTCVIYPMVGHWVWGGAFLPNETWLADMGFIDFAGSTVVHSVGGWVAMVGIWLLGPRLGRYDASGRVLPIKSYNLPIAFLGVLILWLGWWGFNGGSTLEMNADVGMIIANTNLAAAAAGLSAFLHSFLFQGRADLYEKLAGGALGGLVAITACCHMVSPLAAVAIGLSAGIVHNYGYDLIIKHLKLDDPVGAVPVHGICGSYGTLCVALFGNASFFADGASRWDQLGIQAIGIAAVFAFTVFTSSAVFTLLRSTFGLRVSPQEEIRGISYAHSASNLTAESQPSASIGFDHPKL